MARQAISMSDTRMAKAMAHPVRVQALSILNERVASPSDIAEELGLPIGRVSYHVRALLDLGCIEEVETRPVRGALEHRYRAIRQAILPPDEWEALPATARHGFAGQWFENAFGDTVAAIQAGAFDDESADRHMSHTPLRLDADGWKRLSERLDEVLEEARTLQDERSGPEIAGRLTLIAYELPAD
jgi:DNA-binding transcriptional ArsR family regulator